MSRKCRPPTDPILASITRWRGRLRAAIDLVGEIERLLVILIGTAGIVFGAAYGAYCGFRGRLHPSVPPAATGVQSPADTQAGSKSFVKQRI